MKNLLLFILGIVILGQINSSALMSTTNLTIESSNKIKARSHAHSRHSLRQDEAEESES
jgi:hypothetical protein